MKNLKITESRGSYLPSHNQVPPPCFKDLDYEGIWEHLSKREFDLALREGLSIEGAKACAIADFFERVLPCHGEWSEWIKDLKFAKKY